MKKLISFLKQIRLGQILTVFLAGLLILISTACSGGNGLQAQAQTSGQATKTGVPADQVKEEVPEGAETSPLEGGMNEFPDIDPRQDTSAADQKAGSLVDQAEENVTEKSINSPEDLARNSRQAIPLGEQVQGTAEDAVEGTQRGIQNIIGNTQSAASDLFKGTQQAAEDTSDFAQRKTDEAAKGMKRLTDKAPGQAS